MFGPEKLVWIDMTLELVFFGVAKPPDTTLVAWLMLEV
jgi:hypothetical protein